MANPDLDALLLKDGLTTSLLAQIVSDYCLAGELVNAEAKIEYGFRRADPSAPVSSEPVIEPGQSITAIVRFRGVALCYATVPDGSGHRWQRESLERRLGGAGA